MQGCAYIDGAFVAPEDAKISIFDWGFLHSDATYDVAHVWQGRFFRLDDHLDRFERSLKALRLDPGVTREEMRSVMHECVARAGLRDAYVEVLCTRGMPTPGSRDPRSCTNRFMAFAIPFVWIADPDKQRRGVNLIVSDAQRIPAQSVDPRIKNYHWLDFVSGLFKAYDRGGETVVLPDAQGHVTEGPGFNVFAVFSRPGAAPLVVTPDAGVLEGVSRRTAIELARAAGYETQERPLAADELRIADEVFLTSTGGGVIAIAQVDGQPVGGRAPGAFGPVTTQLQHGYWALHADPRYSEAVRPLPGDRA
ncbi:aminotransferase class IV [Ideonella sp. BN130291]|uniref:aminotransferase class IV n=1 Tax=Ideonella sp. BN130291 TaxID=3112940 RepID=UPI002E257A9C|nr:aminotransferase class IV [Ideonella sp. BN130291]